MTGIRFVTDEKGRKVAVQIDLKKHGARLEDFWDGLISESRRKEKVIPKGYRIAYSRVVQKLESLGHTPRPRGCNKLKGCKDQWRIRAGERNGRIRRVNSWAAVTGQPIQCAYPAFRGTRDERLVQIMKKRIDSFSLLLGGVQDFDVEKVVGSDEEWRNGVIEIAKAGLRKAGGQLRAREPRGI